MPNPNTVQFTLPREWLNKLDSLAREGESVSLCAKRILLESLGAPIDNLPSEEIKNRLAEVEQRLQAIEQNLQAKTNGRRVK
ncbi:MAG: hypothetical protein ACRC2V_06035 [Xenococcaceae cyanobacterium]